MALNLLPTIRLLTGSLLITYATVTTHISSSLASAQNNLLSSSTREDLFPRILVLEALNQQARQSIIVNADEQKIEQKNIDLLTNRVTVENQTIEALITRLQLLEAQTQQLFTNDSDTEARLAAEEATTAVVSTTLEAQNVTNLLDLDSIATYSTKIAPLEAQTQELFTNDSEINARLTAEEQKSVVVSKTLADQITTNQQFQTSIATSASKIVTLEAQTQQLFTNDSNIDARLETEEVNSETVATTLIVQEGTNQQFLGLIDTHSTDITTLRSEIGQLFANDASSGGRLSALESYTRQASAELSNQAKTNSYVSAALQKALATVTFDAYRTTSWTGQGVISYEYLEVSIGGGMNITTGVFTAPIAGIYVFHNIGDDNSVNYNPAFVDMNIRKNSVTVLATSTTSNLRLGTYGTAAIVHLNRGDQIDTFLYAPLFTPTLDSYPNRQTHFSGFLLYAL
jgi:phage shock protein A